MVGKQRPPLTPAQSEYLGLDTFGWHTIAWASQSRPGVTHHTQGQPGRGYSCTCPGWQHRQTCKHTLGFDAALAYHLGEPPADPGGAALDAAQANVDGEIEEWLPAALRDHMRRRFDEAVAADGDRWIQSRTAAGVRLTCVACHAVRGWESEGLAAAWLEDGGTCGCGGGGPTASETAMPPKCRARGPESRAIEVIIFDARGRPHPLTVEAQCYGPIAVHRTIADEHGTAGVGYAVSHIGTGGCYRQDLGRPVAVRLARKLAALPIMAEIEANPDYARLLREWARQAMATIRPY
jgi:hypothetical protein